MVSEKQRRAIYFIDFALISLLTGNSLQYLQHLLSHA